MTCVGTFGVCLGTFLCAFVVKSSTSEQVWEAAPAHAETQPFRIMWLQRAKVVGDQAFGSFATYDTVHEQCIRTSQISKDERHRDLGLPWVGLDCDQ